MSPASIGIMNSSSNSKRNIMNTNLGTCTFSDGSPFLFLRKKMVGYMESNPMSMKRVSFK
jgi:hypothetical protein